MGDQWIDVSSNQDKPELLKWSEWGIPRGQYRLAIGLRLDTLAFQHRANMRSAGMKTGSYAVPVENVSLAVLAEQARLWIDNIPPDDENDDWVDAERANLTEPMLSAYCDEYDRRSPRQRLAIYTGGPWWTSHVPANRRARYAKYKLIFASYPFDTPAGKPVPMDAVSVARRSNPPVNPKLAIPLPWLEADGHQYSGQGSKPGYNKFLDHGIYRVNPSVVTPPVTKTLVGLHGRSNGRMQPADFDTVRLAKIEAVKLLSSAAPEDVDTLRSIKPDMLIMVRLFESFEGRTLTSEQFAKSQADGMKAFYNKGVRLFEIHNEPNLNIEGLTSSWNNGVDFGVWFSDVRTRLKTFYPDAKFGFPGISPGGDVAGVRMDEVRFISGAMSAASNADWIGIHVYWNDAQSLADAMNGKAVSDYQRRFPNKPIYVTEFSNSNLPKSVKASQYVDFYKSCKAVAAFSFVVSSPSGFESETWRDESGHQSEITAIVGNRVVMPVPNPIPIPAPVSAIDEIARLSLVSDWKLAKEVSTRSIGKLGG